MTYLIKACPNFCLRIEDVVSLDKLLYLLILIYCIAVNVLDAIEISLNTDLHARSRKFCLFIYA